MILSKGPLRLHCLIRPVWFSLILALSACGSGGGGDDDIAEAAPLPQGVVGSTSVALNANRDPGVRTQETLLGNVVTDALVTHAAAQGVPVDFGVANGGGLRFNSGNHPEGIYPAGDLTEADMLEILPFGNTGVVVSVTGTQLRSILERSVTGLNAQGDIDIDAAGGTGAFLQISQGLRFSADVSRPRQVFDSTVSPTVVVSEGARIVSAQVNFTEFVVDGVVVAPDAIFRMIAPSFIAFGGDSYAAFGAIPEDQKIDFGIDLAIALGDFFRANSPVSPLIEGRITIVTQ